MTYHHLVENSSIRCSFKLKLRSSSVFYVSIFFLLGLPLDFFFLAEPLAFDFEWPSLLDDFSFFFSDYYCCFITLSLSFFIYSTFSWTLICLFLFSSSFCFKASSYFLRLSFSLRFLASLSSLSELNCEEPSDDELEPSEDEDPEAEPEELEPSSLSDSEADYTSGSFLFFSGDAFFKAWSTFDSTALFFPGVYGATLLYWDWGICCSDGLSWP